MRNTELIEELVNLEEDTNQISTNQEEQISRDEEVASGVSLGYGIESIQNKKSSAPYEKIIKIYEELPRVRSITRRIKQRISKIWNQSEENSLVVNHERGKTKKNLKQFTNILSHNWDFNRLEAMKQQYIEEKTKDYKGLESTLLYKLRDVNSELIKKNPRKFQKNATHRGAMGYLPI